MILCTFAHGTRVNGWLTFTKSLCLPLIIWRALVTARSQVALVGTWLRFMMAVCRVDLFTLTEEGDICIILQIKGYYLLLSSFQIDELLLSSTWQYRKKKCMPCAVLIGALPRRSAMSKKASRPTQSWLQEPSSPLAHWTQPAVQCTHTSKRLFSEVIGIRADELTCGTTK
jgi:hypothetical protein